ncbi:putative lipid II flippase FtsW [Gryllotalpicola protaetiae]|uniref:Probable peptidoglycan glycosyltransferase FtsW n=1 Tax=Gryllotalpicola protaetiae TaxID=2419771 RepID=A0A387BKR9_9MICO|nr:putative lipid II flippase FtsW [Gryllotalpicola protaetiae]AYG04755.1 putative lipid II flippase FtsW [Gryllotalpicola protaetiae]
MTTQADRSNAPRFAAGGRAGGAMHSARISLGRAFEAESANYFLLLGLTLFMVAFGLLMVLSSSYVSSHADGSSFFAKFMNQGLYAIIGVPIMLVVSRIPQKFWQRTAWLALLGASLLQVLVVFTPLGYGINNNTNWLKIGPILFQPSELIKIALVLWLGMFLTRKETRLRKFGQALVPALLISIVPLFLIMKGNDLGTTMIVGLMLIGALFFAGVPLWQLLVTGVAAGGAAFVLAFSSANRTHRIMAFLHPEAADPNGDGYQVLQGQWGMANGGVFGVGLGNSQSKWNWLPASSTDFIFSITAEELGLIGAVLVLLLFVALAFVLLRIIRSAKTVFARAVTGGVLVWIIGQAVINIAVVVGLFPVLGVPLPLISSGGTALISTLAALGIVLSFARAEGQPARATVKQ